MAVSLEGLNTALGRGPKPRVSVRTLQLGLTGEYQGLDTKRVSNGGQRAKRKSITAEAV